MAKTVFLNNNAGIVLGYEVDTTVASAQLAGHGVASVSVAAGGSGYAVDDVLTIAGGNGNGTVKVTAVSSGAVTGVSLQNHGENYNIGSGNATSGGSGSGCTINILSIDAGVVKVYPAAIQTIAINYGLNISGIGDVTVTSVATDGGGTYFTFSGSTAPSAGAIVRTPWNGAGALLYTRAANTIALTYQASAEHDLYFGTQKTGDSGSISAVLDGASLGTFSLTAGGVTLVAVLLKAEVAGGGHILVITAIPPTFIYFDKIELVEHIRQTGGFYNYRGPNGTIEDSTINFIGDWSDVPGYAFTNVTGASAFFYPQLGLDGAVKIRVQKTPDSGIVTLFKDGASIGTFDLYANPAVGPVDITLFTQPSDGPWDQAELELRLTGGGLFYVRGTVVVFSRTDLEALTLAANYLRRVGERRGDGAFLDSYDSDRINFDANALYACMGLLAAQEVLGAAEYLDVVKKFLTWLASMQVSAPGVAFDDGHWKIGYRVNPDPPPTYLPAIAPYDVQGITEIRWVDAVQCLPAFVLWWYWKRSGDSATRDALLPAFRKGIEGFITNNYDPNTGFFFSSWQNKTAPTIFLYHDAIRRVSAGGAVLEQHDDAETGCFTYAPAANWSSYGPAGAIGAGEHFTLVSQSYFEFSLSLSVGDKVNWVTQTAWDVGIAEVLVSDDGTNFSLHTMIDGYTQALLYQQEFTIYAAASAETKYFRIRHSGTINAAGASALGWQRLAARYAAGQTDVLLGLTGLWLLTGAQKYAQLAIQIVRRFAGRYWSAAEGRWYVALEGAAPGSGNDFWYPFPHGYTVFGMKQSRYFSPPSRFAASLQALEPYEDEEGGFLPPGYAEPEHIFSAFYVVGENQLALKTDPEKFDLAKEFIKSGQYFLTLAGQQVGGIVFSKRYPYLYTNIAGFACLALAGTLNPITEQLLLLSGTTRMVIPQ